MQRRLRRAAPLGLLVACSLGLRGQADATTPTAVSTARCRLLVFGDPSKDSPPEQLELMDRSLARVAEAFAAHGFEVDQVLTRELDDRVVRERLADYARTLTSDDTFVLYSHCHGGPFGTFFAFWQRFADMILALPARNVVVLAMSCQAGNLTDKLQKRKAEWEGRAAAGRSLVVLTPVDASQNAGPSPEPGIGNPFTYAVITAMQGEADKDRNGRIELQELVDHVFAVTRAKSRDQSYRPQFAGVFPLGSTFVATKPRDAAPLHGTQAATAPGLDPTELPAPAALRDVTAWTIESRVLGERRRVFVAQPPGFDATAHYPVLYLLDGGIDEDFVHVAEAVHFGCTWDRLRPMFIVGIENTDRRRDFTEPTDVEAERAAAPHAGGAARFRAFLRDELMPAVRTRFPTDGRDALVGESLAGLFVAGTLVDAPELFDDYIALSPSLSWNGRAVVRRMRDRLPALTGVKANVYLATADEADIVGAVEEFVGVLREQLPQGVALEYHPMPMEFHDTVFRAAAPRALRRLFGRRD
jgi:predicted alpha/beta superfamily hydrolase